jgi:hypothetical protein
VSGTAVIRFEQSVPNSGLTGESLLGGSEPASAIIRLFLVWPSSHTKPTDSRVSSRRSFKST